MDVNYGQAVKRYLLDKVTLLHIHRFDPNDVQFADALVSSAVVWFRKSLPPKDHAVTFTFGGTLLDSKALTQSFDQSSRPRAEVDTLPHCRHPQQAAPSRPSRTFSRSSAALRPGITTTSFSTPRRSRRAVFRWKLFARFSPAHAICQTTKLWRTGTDCRYSNASFSFSIRDFPRTRSRNAFLPSSLICKTASPAIYISAISANIVHPGTRRRIARQPLSFVPTSVAATQRAAGRFASFSTTQRPLWRTSISPCIPRRASREQWSAIPP